VNDKTENKNNTSGITGSNFLSKKLNGRKMKELIFSLNCENESLPVEDISDVSTSIDILST
tara:strand:- start:119 stop:301 length:183 start_codon:yes stop_codon:yes gene_type:complete